MSDALSFPGSEALKLEKYLPPPASTPSADQRPFVTLTFATSLDASLALAPGTRTVLSGPQSKAMTHFLRRRHAAICVGVGTVEADDPGLNCRLAVVEDGGGGEDKDSVAGARQDQSQDPTRQPRPIVIDPHARWRVSGESKVIRLAREGCGLAPFVIKAAGREPSRESAAVLEQHGGKYISVAAVAEGEGTRFQWRDVLAAVRAEGLESVMIEGGGRVINSLLGAPDNELIDSVILTIAPTWLGQGGVVVSPPRAFGGNGEPQPAVRLEKVEWIPLGEDVVLCGKILR